MTRLYCLCQWRKTKRYRLINQYIKSIEYMFCGFSELVASKTDSLSCSQSIYCEFSKHILHFELFKPSPLLLSSFSSYTPSLIELEGNIIMDSIHFISFRCDAINCVDLAATKLYKQNKHEKCVIQWKTMEIYIYSWHGITCTSMASTLGPFHICKTKPSHSDKKHIVLIFTICFSVASNLFHTE